jgi:hypothetical protein
MPASANEALILCASTVDHVLVPHVFRRMPSATWLCLVNDTVIERHQPHRGYAILPCLYIDQTRLTRPSARPPPISYNALLPALFLSSSLFV